MRKLKAFSSVDLIVVIGLVLVLFGASLTVLKKNFNKTKDETNLQGAATVTGYLKSYHDSNFKLYPVYDQLPSGVKFAHVDLDTEKADGNFLKISLGAKYSTFIDKFKYSSNLVYVYRTDGSEALIVVRKLEDSTKCNTDSSDVPEIIKEYLLQDPTACYYFK